MTASSCGSIDCVPTVNALSLSVKISHPSAAMQADVGFNLCVAPLSEFSPVFTKGGDVERRSGGAEERRSGGAEERRSGGAEE
ncbi:hypothetical protein PAXRUDRAFT_20582 [Paxillus rubicundulus Ve08.2h10]|uniref:Uncharacterized protein n=1 Tax=Paxillus rubicundulus Ve08.2h10 TaxID=930991 RepID=A0A0D0D1F0_9AGAM|nr:hypothetical protein PAXRUDRAFT_20582 [Paxillus rubicundulus Ve08.2h10]